MGRDARPLSRATFLRVVARRGMAVAGAFALGYGVDATWARLLRGPHLERERYPRLVVGGLRIHHNVVGYAAIVVGIFFHPLLLVPFGLGMILGHAMRDRLFWFIEVVE